VKTGFDIYAIIKNGSIYPWKVPINSAYI